MSEVIHSLVQSHGYLLVFVIIMLECAGLPLPGESALISVALYAGATGRLDIYMIAALAAAAAILGDNLGFALGRYVGRPALLRYGSLIRLTPQRLQQGEAFFSAYGAKIIFFGRFIALLRLYAALLAGANGYGWRSFLVYNALGAVVWSALFSFGSYMFGDALMRFMGPLAVVLLMAFAGGVVVLRLILRRLS